MGQKLIKAAPFFMQAPIDVEVKVYLIGVEDKGQVCTVTLGMKRGSYPTEKAIRERVNQFAAEGVPDGFRLMTKREMFNVILAQTTGIENPETVPMPGFSEWDA
jgi:hypothetical protein